MKMKQKNRTSILMISIVLVVLMASSVLAQSIYNSGSEKIVYIGDIFSNSESSVGGNAVIGPGTNPYDQEYKENLPLLVLTPNSKAGIQGVATFQVDFTDSHKLEGDEGETYRYVINVERVAGIETDIQDYEFELHASESLNKVFQVKVDESLEGWQMFVVQILDRDNDLNVVAQARGYVAYDSSSVVEPKPSGTGGSGGEGPDYYTDFAVPYKPPYKPIRSNVELELNPAKQITSTGEAVYKLTVTDKHRIPECVDDKEVACVLGFPSEHTYVLNFRGDLSVGFDKNKVTLGYGESETIGMRLRADDLGAYSFNVFVEETNANGDSNGNVLAKVRGSLIYITEFPEPKPYPQTQFFVGSGFFMNEDETRAVSADFTLLNKDSELSGKMSVEGAVFKVTGSFGEIADGVFGFREYTLDFRLMSPNADGVLARFAGEMKDFGNMKILTGTLRDVEGNGWTLIAFSRQGHTFRTAVIGGSSGVETFTDSVSVSDVVIVEDSTDTSQDIGQQDSVTGSAGGEAIGSTSDVYIKPIEVKERKILGLIPYGKAIKVQIIQGDKISEESISEDSSKVIEGYRIRIGSLENEENFDLEIEKA